MYEKVLAELEYDKYAVPDPPSKKITLKIVAVLELPKCCFSK